MFSGSVKERVRTFCHIHELGIAKKSKLNSLTNLFITVDLGGYLII